MTLETRFPKDDWRSGYFGPENLANTIQRVDELKKIVPAGMTLPEMSLRFILSHPAVSTTIVGMRDPKHVRQNVAASDAGPLDANLLRTEETSLGPHPAKLVRLAVRRSAFVTRVLRDYLI